MATKRFDVNLADGETPADVARLLEGQFMVTVVEAKQQHNSALTVDIIGTEAQLFEVERWHEGL